jgi:hypothetical protein
MEHMHLRSILAALTTVFCAHAVMANTTCNVRTSGVCTNSNLTLTSTMMANTGETTTQSGAEHTARGFDSPVLDLSSAPLTQQVTAPDHGTWALTIVGAAIALGATKLRRRPAAGRSNAALRRVLEG